MVTVEQFESDRTSVPDEVYEPVFLYSDHEIMIKIVNPDYKMRGMLVKYIGTASGTELSPEFHEVLEFKGGL